jgi:molybdopterin-guanine dinucleotide biosynthesis protein A
MSERPELFGLVLAGGASKRMGRDKAALAYRGQTQLARTFDLVSRHCARTFVSVRREQTEDPSRAGYPQILDVIENAGPIAGIAAAQAAHPDVGWLIVACDLPFLDDAAIELLVAQRGNHPITAYRSTHDGLPEPLCAIYEPSTRAGILDAITCGRHCPRKFVIASGVPLLEQPDPSALDNVNTPEEFTSAATRLSEGSTPG